MENSHLKTIAVGIVALCLSLHVCNIKAQNEIQTPEKFFGFKPGSDYNLFTYEKLLEYLKLLEPISGGKLKMIEIGSSPMGRPMYLAVISSASNIKNLDSLKAVNKKLALETELTVDERNKILKVGKVFFLATLSMHSGEVGPSQSLPLIVYDLITTKEPRKIQWLDNVVYMVVPCHNPDGMDMVVEHYYKNKGTKYETSCLPGVYHKYVGHDNNRDFVTLTQSDTRAIAAVYSNEWFPQVMVEKHQMGSTGPRYFLPPDHDPIAENVDGTLYNWANTFGSNMATDMTAQGLKGICQHWEFDSYWPGATQTSMWKGIISMLTEGASARYATPIYIEPTELSVEGKGLSEYKKGINMLFPWEGGWWRLGDLVDLEISSTYSIIKTCAANHEEILKFRNDLSKSEMLKGKSEAPYYYVIPNEQLDQSELVNLVNLLREHGISVYKSAISLTVKDINIKQNDIVVPLAQPYRAFIKEILEKQKYPERHYTPGGQLIEPYDITSWSLPLHRNVKSIEISFQSSELEANIQKINSLYFIAESSIPPTCKFFAFKSENNESYKVAFSAMQNGLNVERLERKVKREGKEIQKGSFIIPFNPKLSETIKKLTVSPIFLVQKPDSYCVPVKMPRIALVESWFHDMDAGWTRYIFDTYSIPFKAVHPGDFDKTDFTKNFDLVIFPDEEKDVLMSGKYKTEAGQMIMSDLAPQYTKGIGKKGMEGLMKFFANGGIILSWGKSTRLFLDILNIPPTKNDSDEFQLPVKDISADLKKAGLSCPGSLLNVTLRTDHPLTLGMPSGIGVFFRGEPVFSTSVPGFDMDRRVIASFPEENILASGYCKQVEKLSKDVAMVWTRKGKGQIILLGFDPIFRASTQGTFKLVFNTILLKKIE